jgi:hypothetical protein
MTTSNELSLAISSLALVTSGLGTAFYFVQTREIRRSNSKLEAQLEDAAAEELRSTLEGTSRAFLEYPKIRTVFHPDESEDGKGDALTHEDTLRANTLCEDFLDAFERVLQVEKDNRRSWSGSCWPFYDDLMQRSDFIYDYLERHDSWYLPELLERAKEVRLKMASRTSNSP